MKVSVVGRKIKAVEVVRNWKLRAEGEAGPIKKPPG
jgi:hypothetical protein